DSAGGLLGRQHRLLGAGDQDVRLELDQLGGQGGKPIPLVRRVAVLQADGLPLHIAEVAEPLPKGIAVEGRDIAGVREVRGVAGPEPADEWDFPLWLRPGDEWRREDAQGEGHDAPNSVELHDDLLAGQDAPTSLFSSLAVLQRQPNAGRQARLEAAATEERSN